MTRPATFAKQPEPKENLPVSHYKQALEYLAHSGSGAMPTDSDANHTARQHAEAYDLLVRAYAPELVDQYRTLHLGAQFASAMMLLLGQKRYAPSVFQIPQDDHRAFALLQEAAERKHPKSQAQLAEMLLFGRGTDLNLWCWPREQGYYDVPFDPELALYWLQRAIYTAAESKRTVKAKVLFGLLHLREEQYERAFDMLRLAIKEQLPSRSTIFDRQIHNETLGMAHTVMGSIHLLHDEVLPAVRAFQAAEDRRHPLGSYFLGVCAERGLGIPQDVALAARHYYTARERGMRNPQLHQTLQRIQSAQMQTSTGYRAMHAWS